MMTRNNMERPFHSISLHICGASFIWIFTCVSLCPLIVKAHDDGLENDEVTPVINVCSESAFASDTVINSPEIEWNDGGANRRDLWLSPSYWTSTNKNAKFRLMLGEPTCRGSPNFLTLFWDKESNHNASQVHFYPNGYFRNYTDIYAPDEYCIESFPQPSDPTILKLLLCKPDCGIGKKRPCIKKCCPLDKIFFISQKLKCISPSSGSIPFMPTFYDDINTQSDMYMYDSSSASSNRLATPTTTLTTPPLPHFIINHPKFFKNNCKDGIIIPLPSSEISAKVIQENMGRPVNSATFRLRTDGAIMYKRVENKCATMSMISNTFCVDGVHGAVHPQDIENNPFNNTEDEYILFQCQLVEKDPDVVGGKQNEYTCTEVMYNKALYLRSLSITTSYQPYNYTLLEFSGTVTVSINLMIICFFVILILYMVNSSQEKYLNFTFGILLVTTSIFPLITSVVYILLWKKQNVHGWSIAATSGSLFFMYIFQGTAHLIGGTLNVAALNTFYCRFIGVLAHFFMMSIFTWCSVMTFDLFITFRSVVPMNQRLQGLTRYLKYSAFGWGVPFITVAIGILMDFMVYMSDDCSYHAIPAYGQQSCGPMENSMGVYLYYPAGFLLCVNISLFTATCTKLFMYGRSTATANRARRNNDAFGECFSRFAKLFCVMGISWGFECVSWYVDGLGYYWYWNIIDVFNILRAVAVFAIYVCKTDVIKQLEDSYPTLQRIYRPFGRLFLRKCADEISTESMVISAVPNSPSTALKIVADADTTSCRLTNNGSIKESKDTALSEL